jgi:hypothetical protein
MQGCTVYIGKFPTPLGGISADVTWGKKYEKMEENKMENVKEKGENKKRG